VKIESLLEIYRRNLNCQLIKESLLKKEKQIHLKGVRSSLLSILVSTLSNEIDNPYHLIVVEDRERASYIQNDIENLLGKEKSMVFPMSYKRAYQFQEIDNANVLERSEVLNKCSTPENTPVIIISYPEALAEKVVNKQSLVKHSHTISIGDQLDTEFLSEVLIDYGFEKTDFVYEAGNFSIRGGIVDIFSFSNEKPYRIELFGKEVESIRTFDPESQLSLDPQTSLILTPDIQTKLNQENRESLLSFLKNPIVWIDDLSSSFQTSIFR